MKHEKFVEKVNNWPPYLKPGSVLTFYLIPWEKGWSQEFVKNIMIWVWKCVRFPFSLIVYNL